MFRIPFPKYLVLTEIFLLTQDLLSTYIFLFRRMAEAEAIRAQMEEEMAREMAEYERKV